MIEWKRVETGTYVSADGRFTIRKTYSRAYGNPWVLRDAEAPDAYKGTYAESTLLGCKMKAEDVAATKREA